jgi:hypothetical protein
MELNSLFQKKWMQFSLFLTAGIIIFFPIITNSFASDDFLVLNRVCLNKQIWIKNFFRPLSDLTLYLNFLIGRFNPSGYFIFNIFIHCINSFLLYRLCLIWKWAEDNQRQRNYAFAASVLFLTYPFHSEGIVWLLGRGASMAVTFALSVMLILVGNLSEAKKILYTILLFFIGLATYESVILLGFIIPVFLYGVCREKKRPIILWISLLTTIFAFHLFVRIKIAGSIFGAYGSGFFKSDYLTYVSNFAKAAGRLFLPPSANNQLQSISMMFLFVCVLILAILILKKNKDNPLIKSFFSVLTILLAITLIIPTFAGVSTKTSESDRFLYTPSLFFCCWLSFMLTDLIVTQRRLLLILTLVVIYNLFFLEKTNLNWRKASGFTRNILATIIKEKNSKKIYLINLPTEWNGAFIFRQGLREALLLNKIDTSSVIIVNQLKWRQMINLPEIIGAYESSNKDTIPPATVIEKGSTYHILSEQNTVDYIISEPGSALLFWNKQELKKIPINATE